MTTKKLSWPILACLGFLLAFPLLAVPTTQAGDLALTAQLIWGTDDAKPKDKDLKDLDSKIREKLCKVFKWKNYFQVGEKKVELGRKETKRVKMSGKCEIELKFVDDATVEIKLFGEGKHTGTLRKSLKAIEQGELCVVAGDDKDRYGDAWFVIISLAKAEAAPH